MYAYIIQYTCMYNIHLSSLHFTIKNSLRTFAQKNFNTGRLEGTFNDQKSREIKDTYRICSWE